MSTAGLCALGTALPAHAATESADAVHRGSTTCFNYSWGDGGVISTTVYASNTCGSTKRLQFSFGGVIACMVVAGHDQEHHSYGLFNPSNFKEVGSCPPGTGD